MEAFPLNISIVSWLNHWANSSLYVSNLVIFCAVYLGWLMLLGLLVYIYRAHRRWKAFRIALLSAAAGLLALLAADLIKSIYPVARPGSLAGIKALFSPGDPMAFPSSHAAFFGGLALYLFARNRYWGGWFILFAFLVGLGRVMAGVHFPLDILAGWALAGLAVLAWLWLGKKFS